MYIAPENNRDVTRIHDAESRASIPLGDAET